MHFPAMYRLYLILKDHTDPPTDEEIVIASGEKVLDAEGIDTYLEHVDIASANLRSMFVKQTQENAVSLLFSNVNIVETEHITIRKRPLTWRHSSNT